MNISLKILNIGMVVQKWNFLILSVRIKVNIISLKNNLALSYKIEHELNSSILFLSIYAGETLAHEYQNTCMKM